MECCWIFVLLQCLTTVHVYVIILLVDMGEMEFNTFLSCPNWIPQIAIYFFHICLSENEIPIGNALFNLFFSMECVKCLVKGRFLKFISKFKFINVIAIEWKNKNVSVSYTLNYLLWSTISLLTCHSCFFRYMQSCPILWSSIYSNIICQKIFNFILKSFKFTLNCFKFSKTTP